MTMLWGTMRYFEDITRYYAILWDTVRRYNERHWREMLLSDWRAPLKRWNECNNCTANGKQTDEVRILLVCGPNFWKIRRCLFDCSITGRRARYLRCQKFWQSSRCVCIANFTLTNFTCALRGSGVLVHEGKTGLKLLRISQDILRYLKVFKDISRTFSGFYSL